MPYTQLHAHTQAHVYIVYTCIHVEHIYCERSKSHTRMYLYKLEREKKNEETNNHICIQILQHTQHTLYTAAWLSFFSVNIQKNKNYKNTN